MLDNLLDQFQIFYNASVAEVSAISFESSSSDKVEWEIGEDDKYEAQIQGEKNEMKHNKIKEHIFWQPQ